MEIKKHFMNTNLEKLLLEFYEQFKTGVSAGLNIDLKNRKYKTVDSIVICGMGGSALPADIINYWQSSFKNLHKNIRVHKDYGLPADINKNSGSLIICISYSGNTEETLSAYKEAFKKHLPVISIASGGKLELISKKNRNPIAKVPAGIPPRFALSYQLGALVGIFNKIGFLSQNDIKKLLKEAGSVNYHHIRKTAPTLVKNLNGRIPIIYASGANTVLTYLLKINFNENAKIPAFINVFPELNHNEFNGFAVLSPEQRKFTDKFTVLILTDDSDRIDIKKRMRITGLFIRKSSAKIFFLPLSGNSLFKKTFGLLLLGQWASILLAEKYKVNPLPTDLIENFKKHLNK